MITKEEYKKTLIRMWDSVRKAENKGQDTCYGVDCVECPMNDTCGTHAENIVNVYKLIEFVEKWAKEHPIETNGSRFLKNYPKAVVYGCNYDDGFIYIRLDTSNPIFRGVEDCAKISIEWWESEVDNANCD